MKFSNFYQKFDLVLIIAISFGVLVGTTVLVDKVYRESVGYSVKSWANSEASTILEGDTFQAITRAEKYFVDSGYLDGFQVEKIVGKNKINFLAYGTTEESSSEKITEFDTIKIKIIGLFSYKITYVFETKPDMVFIFYYRPKSSIYFVLGFSALIVCIFGLSFLLLKLKSNQRLETLKKFNSYVVKLSTQVAHDLRSPLSAIKIGAGSLNLQNSEAGALVLKSIVRIEKIASDLLSDRSAIEKFLSQTDMNSGANICSGKKINRSIEGIVQELQFQSIRSVKIQYTSNIDKMNSSNVFIKNEDFERILSNLIINAIEASESHGLVSVVSEFDETFLKIEIKDSGKGIPEEVLPRIGERGFSFDKQGNGLGISNAIEVLRSHGGFLQLAPNSGKGTKVEVYLALI